MPAAIAALEAEQHAIDAQLADNTLYVKDAAKALLLSSRHGQIDDELLAAMERLEELGGTV